LTRQSQDAAAAGKASAGSDERKLADYYTGYLDEQAIEAKGTTPPLSDHE
jgi:predicted metalloendopeptidase